MKFYTISISSLLGFMGFIPFLTAPVQAQECPITAGGASAITCAKVYNATPERVQLSGAVGELNIDTDPRKGSEIRAFTTAAPSPGNSLYPNNVLETATYARADLQFNDGTLVWLKPDTQVTLSDDNRCEPALSQNSVSMVIPSSVNQKLCLLSGSVLVMTPANSNINRSNLTVKTDEATVWNPATIYLVTRNQQQKRTEIFVFSGNQVASVATSPNIKTTCGNDSQQLRSNCGFRVMAGEYLTVTNQGRSLVKPFDLPAWVVTDPFFAPLRANTSLRELGGNAVMSQGVSLQPPVAMNTIQTVQPGLLKTFSYQASTYCPMKGVSDIPLAVTQLPPPQFNPFIIPPAPVLAPVPYTPPPIRGMW
jgi:hypothetical protein